MAKNGASCVSRGACPYLWWLAKTDPPRLTALATAFSKLRSAAPRLHGVVHDTPSPMASLPLAAI